MKELLNAIFQATYDRVDLILMHPTTWSNLARFCRTEEGRDFYHIATYGPDGKRIVFGYRVELSGYVPENKFECYIKAQP